MRAIPATYEIRLQVVTRDAFVTPGVNVFSCPLVIGSREMDAIADYEQP